MLMRIRNGVKSKFEVVEIPLSKIKVDVAKVLKEEGFIRDYSIDHSGIQGTIRIDLKYGPSNEKVITGLKRISKPGLRKYSQSKKTPTVLSGLGVAILSTSKGVMTDRQARKENVGGEILCEVW